jgi:hypothetical protein
MEKLGLTGLRVLKSMQQ